MGVAMLVPVTALYASLLTLIMIDLAFRVGSRRGRLQISMGDGGDPQIVVDNRRHLNFVEHVPMAVILMGIVELNGAPKLWLYIIGAVVVIARILHPIGLNAQGMGHPFRTIGAMLTMLSTVTLVGIALWQVLSRGLP